MRPRLVVDEEHISVVQPVGRITFARDDLVSASAGRFLVLHRRSGEAVRVWSVTNTNVAVALGRPGATGRVADELNRGRMS